MDYRDMSAAQYGVHSKEAIARRLRAVRASLGLTQEQIAERLRIEVGVYAHRETARSFVTFGELWRLYDAFGVEPNFILFGDARALGPQWASIRAQLAALDEQAAEPRPRKGRPPSRRP